MTIFTAVLIFGTVCLCNSIVDATICKPFSGFKIDCDECMCSASGREYTCYTRECEPSMNEMYDARDAPINQELRSDDIPFVNDEIPNSREDLQFDNEFEDNDIYDSKRFQDVDSNEDSVYNRAQLDDRYRYKRSSKPLALNLRKKLEIR